MGSAVTHTTFTHANARLSPSGLFASSSLAPCPGGSGRDLLWPARLASPGKPRQEAAAAGEKRELSQQFCFWLSCQTQHGREGGPCFIFSVLPLGQRRCWVFSPSCTPRLQPWLLQERSGLGPFPSQWMVVCSRPEALKPSSVVRGVAKAYPAAIWDGRAPSPQQCLCPSSPPAAWLQSCPLHGARLGPGDAWGEWWGCSRLPGTICHPCLEERVPSTGRDLSYAPLAGHSTGCAGQSRNRAGMSSEQDAGFKPPAEHPQAKKCPEMGVSPHAPASCLGMGSRAHSCAGAALVFLCKPGKQPPMVLTLPPVR